jgi:hypothetical protein
MDEGLMTDQYGDPMGDIIASLRANGVTDEELEKGVKFTVPNSIEGEPPLEMTIRVFPMDEWTCSKCHKATRLMHIHDGEATW